MKKTVIYMMLISLALILPKYLHAEEEFPQRSIEVGLAYDYLTPDSTYDDWTTEELKYYHRFNPHNTIFAGVGVSVRDESLAWLQTALYRDWTPRLSTYTSVSAATKTKWMGKYRFDNDFNIKLGSDYRYIFTTGQSLVYYDQDKMDYILSVGGIIYLPHLILDGRYFFNRSDPGGVWSNSTKLSIGFGTRGKYWTTLVGMTGGQAYLGLGNQFEVNQDVNSISILQEIWLSPQGGIKFGAGYLTIKDGYDKYNANIGCFWQIP